MATTKRVYGKEFAAGDIIHNMNDSTVFCSLNFGFMGRQTINFAKNNNGGYDILKPFTRNGEDRVAKIGQTFPVKDRNNNPVNGLTSGKFALGVKYDKQQEKLVTDDKNALFVTTHKLKEPKKIKEGLQKVGYLTAKFGIEADERQEKPQNEAPTQQPSNEEAPF